MSTLLAALDLASSSDNWGLGLASSVQHAAGIYGQALQEFATLCYQQLAEIQSKTPAH